MIHHEFEFGHIQPKTSKVQPAADYRTIDVKMTSKVQPAADYRMIDRENLGTRLCYLTKSEMAASRFTS